MKSIDVFRAAAVRGLFFGLAVACHAGPLTPPGGPVTSTGKTLVEVEPRIAISAASTPGDADSVFRIIAPGSYYLTGPVTGVTGKTLIEIASSDVTIDLMGYALKGVPSALAGIRASVAATQVTIRNGVVSGFPVGIDIYFPSRVDGCVIEDIHAGANTGVGISAGDRAIVRRCVSSGNTGIGIATGTASVVESCVSSENGARGFVADPGTSFANCISFDNLGDGFNMSIGSLTNCIARTNSGDGFNITSAVLTGCMASFNDSAGVNASSSLVVDCVANGNATHGFVLVSDSQMLRCTADSNSGSVTDGAGVLVTGADNRIDSNQFTDNDRGVRVVGAGNLIVRNTCSGNTINFDIAASNRYGSIVNISAAGAAAVSGSSAAGVLTTTDPWANFAY